MSYVKYMALTYDENRQVCKYVHSTSRGHEAIQLAVGLQLKPSDYCAPYYRDESMLLGLGYEPYELMLQLLAKRDDPFSGGRSYYAHPCARRADMPLIPHQSSATGMQAIPATGMAQGIQYLEKRNMLNTTENPVVVCSFGDGSITEGEVSEAFQFAVLKELPIIYLIQDNEWGISVSAEEMRTMDAYEFAAGFKGLKRVRVDGTHFKKSYECIREEIKYVRATRKPVLIHAKVSLLNHHTSGVRKEMYRSVEDLEKHTVNDPLPALRKYLLELGLVEEILDEIDSKAKIKVEEDFYRAVQSAEPDPATVMLHEFAPTPVIEEKGIRNPQGRERVVMVDAALHAIDEILKTYPEAIFSVRM